jgi:glycosyltransferase involved in cell wall biosynthesis
MSSPIRITHLITGLCTGGAEIMLLRLLSRTDCSRFEPDVISMLDIGPTGEKIRSLGIRVRTLGLSRAWPNPLALFRLVRWLRADPPHLLATWMYHANFLGSLAAPLAGGIPVVWGIHHGRLDASLERQRTIWLAKACGWMSHHFAAAVICCSACSFREHLRLGYDPARMVIIRNGFDLSLFRPDGGARYAVRRELGIDAKAPVLFMAGRFHPQKDHRMLVEAAAILRLRLPSAHFILCGHEVTWQNPTLASWIESKGLRNAFHLLGTRQDTARLVAASDLACSSSVCGEAFSLAIGEAMCCEVPCVVTDVGDSAFLVGDTGLAVPAGHPQIFAAACARLLELPDEQRRELGRRARWRIDEHFELSHIVSQYEALYQHVLGRAPIPRKAAA